MTEETLERAMLLGKRLNQWEVISRVLHCTVESGFKYDISLVYGLDLTKASGRGFNFLKFPKEEEFGVRAKFTAWVDEEIRKTKKELEAL